MAQVRRAIRLSDDRHVSLPKLLFQPGRARRLEAERDEADAGADAIAGHDGADVLAGNSAGDRLSGQGARQDSHWFLLPTTGDDDEIVVTGRKLISDNHRHVLVGGKYRENPNFNPRFNPTLGQAIGIPALVGAGLAFPPLLAELATAARGFGTLDKLEQNARLRGDHKLADHYAEPYPQNLMGEHVIPRRWAKYVPIAAPVINNPANVLRPAGITRGGMYQRHAECDNRYNGGPLPRRMNDAGWSAKREGIKKHGPLRWALECTTPAMKAAAGAGAAASAAAFGVHNALKKEDAAVSRSSSADRH